MSPAEIRAFRTARGWSQRRFAEELGTSLAAVGEWEAGKLRPPAMLKLACAALRDGLSPWEAGSEPVFIEAPVQSTELGALVAQIVSLRRQGYEPASVTLSKGEWEELRRIALGSAFAHLIEDVKGARSLAGVVVEEAGRGQASVFSCRRT